MRTIFPPAAVSPPVWALAPNGNITADREPKKRSHHGELHTSGNALSTRIARASAGTPSTFRVKLFSKRMQAIGTLGTNRTDGTAKGQFTLV